MKRLALISLVAATLALAAGAARADVTIQMKQNGTPQQVCLKTHMLAVTRADGMTIFRGDKKVLWNVNTTDKTCQEMTEADVKAAGEQISAASSQMEEAMKNMPPEQRAMMEKMMAKRMPPKGASPADRVVAPLGQARTINGFACNGYTVKSSDGALTEVWATDPAAAHLAAGDLAVFTEFADFMKNMLRGIGSGMQDWIKDYAHPRPQDVPGLPILTIVKDKSGKEVASAELVAIDHGQVPADKFEVPVGYKTERMMQKNVGE